MECTCKKKDCYFCWLKGRVYTVAAPKRVKPVTLRDVLERVSAESGVPVEQITGRSRKENVRIARQMFCYVARSMESSPGVPRWTLMQIAGMVNHKQHSTVSKSVETVIAMLYGLSREPKYIALGYKLGV